jgi:hypothetical protein
MAEKKVGGGEMVVKIKTQDGKETCFKARARTRRAPGDWARAATAARANRAHADAFPRRADAPRVYARRRRRR